MKRIKDRPMTPLLLKQLAIQEQRIKQIMSTTMFYFNSQFVFNEGTIWSSRFRNYGYLKTK